MEGEQSQQDPTTPATGGGADGEASAPAATSAAAGDSSSAESNQASQASGQRGQSSSATEGTDPPRRKRRRRRKKKAGGGEAAGAPGREHQTAVPTQPAASNGSAPPAPRADASAINSLAAGLFSHLDERQVPCKVDGCDNTWGWTAQEQIQAFGQPPPRRMCGRCTAKFTALEDRAVACANPGCARTWTWAKSSQVAQMQRNGSAKPPSKVCPECTKEERELPDRDVSCRVEGCKRTWTWSRDAQLKHRTWARRNAEEQARGGAAPSAPDNDRGRGKRKRGRRRQRVDVNEAPRRMCELCREKMNRLQEREGPCKVHGCTRMAMVDRESQLRAWARLGTQDLEAEANAGRRMCEHCREFCRAHPDRAVPCGRPGCDKSWTYKTGAQLQDFLAGRRQDPIRLCSECTKGGMMAAVPGAPAGAEVMPCVVPMCEGLWFYQQGITQVAPGNGELPVDRMCDSCRQERGQPSRAPAVEPESTSVEPEGGSPAQAEGVAESPEPHESTAASAAAVMVTEPGSQVASSTEPVVDEAGAANEAVAANEANAANEPTAANEATAANEGDDSTTAKPDTPPTDVSSPDDVPTAD